MSDAFQFFFVIGIVFLASGCTPAVARHVGVTLIVMAFVAGTLSNFGLV